LEFVSSPPECLHPDGSDARRLTLAYVRESASCRLLKNRRENIAKAPVKENRNLRPLRLTAAIGRSCATGGWLCRLPS